MRIKLLCIGLFALTCVIPLADLAGKAQASTEPPVRFWAGFNYDGNYRIEVDKPDSLFHLPISIKVTGLQPGQPVTLCARATDKNARVWESRAAFKADDTGVVDVSRSAPLYGTYRSADPMGLFWSMLPVGAKRPQSSFFAWPSLDPIIVDLRAEANGRLLTGITITRRFIADPAKLVRRSPKAAGLVGVFYQPDTPGPHPAVIILGGGEGGFSEFGPATLTNFGYAVLSLAYFGLDPLPKDLVEIPLEYFEKALAWLCEQPGVDPTRIAVEGGSKGAELALLLGAFYPDKIKAVVALKPSAVVWNGFYRSGLKTVCKTPVSSWSYHSQPLPFLTRRLNAGEICRFVFGPDFVTTPAFLRALEDDRAIATAAIPVERINGPVLLVSGREDQDWPSAMMAAMIERRLKTSGHPHPCLSLVYEGAGHLISGMPYFPSIGTHWGNRFEGGTPEANAFAAYDSWPRILAFLDAHLKSGKG